MAGIPPEEPYQRALIGPTTATLDVAADRLELVEDPEARERYAAEASRMADGHDPDDGA
jgi:hypothetical protein